MGDTNCHILQIFTLVKNLTTHIEPKNVLQERRQVTHKPKLHHNINAWLECAAVIESA